MKQITVDYIFRTSPKILFKRLSTASGLNEWFADDVTIKKDVLTFKWQNDTQSAKRKIDSKKMTVRLDWLDENKEYLEFMIEESNMSSDISLFVTDFIEDDEDEDDAREFWDDTIKRFKRKLGLKA